MKTLNNKLKTIIITTIANNFRNKLPIARNIKVQHINYMYQYNYMQLLKSYYKALVL